MTDNLFDDLLDLGEEDVTHVERTSFQRAPFGMPGAKYRSLKHILPHLPINRDTVWVDHFGGTGVVSWNVEPCKLMVYNDRYSGVTDFYQCLRETPKQLCDYLGAMVPHSRQEWIHAKKTWVTETDPVVRAAKWFYMYRLSVIGKGAAFARATNSASPTNIADIMEVVKRVSVILRRFQVENLDALVCMQDYDAVNAVHYFDPPYLNTDTGIYEHSWTRDNMSELLRRIGNLQGFVALSHYPDEMIDACDFWTDKHEWNVHLTSEAQAYTDQNYKANKEFVQTVGSAKEVLWVKEHK